MRPPISPFALPPAWFVSRQPKCWRVTGAGSGTWRLLNPSQPGSLSNDSRTTPAPPALSADEPAVRNNDATMRAQANAFIDSSAGLSGECATSWSVDKGARRLHRHHRLVPLPPLHEVRHRRG